MAHEDHNHSPNPEIKVLPFYMFDVIKMLMPTIKSTLSDEP